MGPVVGGGRRGSRRALSPPDVPWLERSDPAGEAYDGIGEPDKARPELQSDLHHAGAAGDEQADKALSARFALAQMLAAAGRADDALAELESVRPLLVVAFGADSTHVRNLDKHIDRLGTLKEHSLSRRADELGR